MQSSLRTTLGLGALLLSLLPLSLKASSRGGHAGKKSDSMVWRYQVHDSLEASRPQAGFSLSLPVHVPISNRSRRAIRQLVSSELMQHGAVEGTFDITIELLNRRLLVLFRSREDWIRVAPQRGGSEDPPPVFFRLREALEGWFLGVETRSFSLQYAAGEEVAAVLEKVIPKERFAQKDLPIAFDKRSNTLVITASPSVLDEIQETVRTLDRRTSQVLIRVLIAEVTLDRNTQFGIEWDLAQANQFGNPGQSGRLQTDFGQLSNPSQAALTGLKYSVLEAGKLQAFLHSLRTRSAINVLSSPQLLTSNNRSAYFEETVKVPILTTVTTATGVITTSVDYADIGIKMDVSPLINRDEVIQLAIEQTIQNILPNATVQNAPTFSNRVVRTSVLARDGNTVIIGGLLKDNETESLQKVPVLGDLPGIKHLFRRKVHTNEKTELMVFLTPQIVRKDRTMDEVLDELEAPQIKARLKKNPERIFRKPDAEGSDEVLVLDWEGSQVILGGDGIDELPESGVFEVVRPARAHYHPLTNQLVETEAQVVGSLSIQKSLGGGARGNVVHQIPGKSIQPGDRVRVRRRGYAFEGFRLEHLDVVMDRSPNGFLVDAVLTSENDSGRPLLVTTTEEEDEGESPEFFQEVGGTFRKLRTILTQRGPRQPRFVKVFLKEMVPPGAKSRLKIRFLLPFKDPYRESAEAMRKDPEFFKRLKNQLGPWAPHAHVTVEIRLPGKVKLRGFDHHPLVDELPSGGVALRWTHRGTPFRFSGEYRFQDPRRVLERLGKKNSEASKRSGRDRRSLPEEILRKSLQARDRAP